MISTGTELTDFVTALNGGATIDPDLLDVLVDNARTVIEDERPWQVLKNSASLDPVTTANVYSNAISLDSVDGFSRFYGDTPLVLVEDGGNRLAYYRQIPFDRLLEYRDVSGVFAFDENANVILLMGTVPFNGTPFINYIVTTTGVDLTSDSPVWSPFPSRFLPILGYYAIGIYKGGIDYDTINRQMLPTNAAALQALKNAMEKWDNERQLSALDYPNPNHDNLGYPRSGAIDPNA